MGAFLLSREVKVPFLMSFVVTLLSLVVKFGITKAFQGFVKRKPGEFQAKSRNMRPLPDLRPGKVEDEVKYFCGPQSRARPSFSYGWGKNPPNPLSGLRRRMAAAPVTPAIAPLRPS